MRVLATPRKKKDDNRCGAAVATQVPFGYWVVLGPGAGEPYEAALHQFVSCKCVQVDVGSVEVELFTFTRRLALPLCYDDGMNLESGNSPTTPLSVAVRTVPLGSSPEGSFLAIPRCQPLAALQEETRHLRTPTNIVCYEASFGIPYPVPGSAHTLFHSK